MRSVIIDGVKVLVEEADSYLQINDIWLFSSIIHRICRHRFLQRLFGKANQSSSRPVDWEHRGTVLLCSNSNTRVPSPCVQ